MTSKYSIPPIDVNERVNKDYAKLVRPWKLPSARKICFYNANLIETTSGTVLPNMNIYVSEGKIQYITKSNGSEISAEYSKIDSTGKYLCPGLMDNHVHVTSVQGETDLTKLMTMPATTAMMRFGQIAKDVLYRGFTTIRDCGGAQNYLRDAVEEGVYPGPRMIICGKALSQTGGHADMRSANLPGEASDGGHGECSCHLNLIGEICDGVEQCLKSAREQLRLGASFIKIMGGGGVASPTDKITNLQFLEEEIQAIVRVAKTYGTYVTAHAYTPEAIQHCIKNGVKGIEHGNLIDEPTAKMMAELGCYLTPTLIAYKIMASDQFSDFMSESGKAKNNQVLTQGLESLLIARDYGVTICHGSDLLGSLQGYQTQEFFLRGKVLTAAEVLKSATVNVALCNGIADQFGQIKAGFAADLLLMNSNPLEDIGVLDEPETNLAIIMKDGLIYKNQVNGHLDVSDVHRYS